MVLLSFPVPFVLSIPRPPRRFKHRNAQKGKALSIRRGLFLLLEGCFEEGKMYLTLNEAFRCGSIPPLKYTHIITALRRQIVNEL